MDVDSLGYFMRRMDSLMNLGLGEQCFLESAITSGKARLPRRLKKATKKYMRLNKLSSMVIMPQAQFVCFDKKGRLIVCHTKY